MRGIAEWVKEDSDSRGGSAKKPVLRVQTNCAKLKITDAKFLYKVMQNVRNIS